MTLRLELNTEHQSVTTTGSFADLGSQSEPIAVKA